MSRRYAVVYADPPWRYSSKHHGYGGAEDHYPTMDLDDIRAIPVPAADDCALFMWATMPLLRHAFEVVEAWGFKYKTTAFCWVKQNKSGIGLVTGLGYWTRSNVEVCLLATRGRPRPISHRVHSVVVSPRGRHSQKPDEVRRRIVELMGQVPRLEMFARVRTPGWDAWGNEIHNSIELALPTVLDRRDDSASANSRARRARRCSIAS
jgi:N6-adenosine-specific RNA methylase IME4